MDEKSPIGERTNLEITDRELILAVFKLVGSLAEKMTGLHPSVTLTDRKTGNYVRIDPSMTAEITWKTEAQHIEA